MSLSLYFCVYYIWIYVKYVLLLHYQTLHQTCIIIKYSLMKKNFLFPTICSRIGWLFLLFGAVYLILVTTELLPEINVTVFSILPSDISITESGRGCYLIHNDISDELGTVAIMVGLLLIAFSAERDEDEFTDALRLRSWYLAGISYAVVYILCDLLIYEIAYLQYMWFVQGGLLILLYILIFKSKIHLSRRSSDGQ